MPCKGGYRANIEAGKKRREQERIYEQSAERKHWQALVQRVHEDPAGFQRLTASEKTYFAVSCLIGEVYNGGFDQFFSNSAGSLYAYALDGLFEMGAEESAAQLARAKQMIFGDALIPVNREERNVHTRKIDSNDQLETLDKAFWADHEQLGERCKQFAIAHAIYKEDD